MSSNSALYCLRQPKPLSFVSEMGIRNEVPFVRLPTRVQPLEHSLMPSLHHWRTTFVIYDGLIPSSFFMGCNLDSALFLVQGKHNSALISCH